MIRKFFRSLMEAISLSTIYQMTGDVEEVRRRMFDA